MLLALWRDENGVIVSTELVLIVTILGIGLVVGLTTLRNDVVTELADQAQAVSNVDQTYFFSGTTGHSASTAGSAYTDTADFCEAGGAGGTNEQCVVIGGGGNGNTGGGGGGGGGGNGTAGGGGGNNTNDNRSGLGDGTNPGEGGGRSNSPNMGTNNPNNKP